MKNRFLLCIAFAFFSLYSSRQNTGLAKGTNTADLIWESTNFPATVRIRKLIVHPSDPHMLFAVVENGDYAGLWKRTDGGNWVKKFPLNSISNNTWDVSVDICNPQKIYIGIDNTVRWSNDYGESGFDTNKYTFGDFDHVMAVAACNNKIIVGIDWFDRDKIRISEDGGIIFSSDKIDRLAANSFWRIAFDPNDPNHNRAFFAHESMGIFKSTDHGNTWVQKNDTLPPCLTGIYIPDIIFNDVSIIITVNSCMTHGIYKSTNQGETWFPINSAFQGTNTSAIKFDTLNHIYVGTNNQGSLTAKGVYYSENGGIDFVDMNNGLIGNLNIHDLAYGDWVLYAATDAGVWQCLMPQLSNKNYLPYVIR